MTGTTDNDVIYFAKLHWIIFVWPVVLFFGGMILGIEFWQLKEVSIFLVLFALAWGLMTWVNYRFSSLTIKKGQVILRSGFLVRQTIDIPIAKIESIDIRQSVGGSIFQYGFLLITGTGGTRNSINHIAKPLTCRRYIEQLTHG